MKKVFAVLLALTLLLSFAACGKEEETNSAEKIQFTVIVTHKDKTEKIFLYEVDAGSKVGAVLENAGLIDSEGADQGMFHTADGEKADWNADQSYWGFYIDDQYATTGIYDTVAQNGKTYRLVYTIGF